MGKSVNVRGPGLQNVLLCHVEASPLKTMGSLVTPLTSLHSVSRGCILAAHTPVGSTFSACTLLLSSTRNHLSGIEWLPPSTPFRSLTHITPSQ